MPIDPDELMRSFEERVDDQTQRALRFSADLEAAEAEVGSPGGEVTVRVNSAGGLSGLVLHPEADRLGRDELAALVLTTSRRAQARVAERVSELATAMYGAGSGTATFITDAYAIRYPAPPADDPADDPAEGQS